MRKISQSFVVLSLSTLAASISCPAAVNNWTNPASAHWEAPYWSLGILPDQYQAVTITNSGYKAVGVFPSTPVNFPNAMTVFNLAISAPNNALSTLLLNYAGTAIPLRVGGACYIGTNGSLVNLYSGLEVDGAGGGQLTVDSGTLIQQGGSLVATSAVAKVLSGSLAATNASLSFGLLFDLDQVTLDNCACAITNYFLWGTTEQIDGVNVLGTLHLASDLNPFSPTPQGHYVLRGGWLEADAFYAGPNGTSIFDQYGGTNSSSLVSLANCEYSLHKGALFAATLHVGDNSAGADIFQSTGTVRAASLLLGSPPFERSPGVGYYELDAGALESGQAVLGWEGGLGFLVQAGGWHRITNSLQVQGAAFLLGEADSTYTLSAGTLCVSNISLGVLGTFVQTGGSNLVATSLTLAGGYYVPDINYILDGGTLIDSNTMVAGSIFQQTGGVHVVINTLTLVPTYYSSTYELSGGTLLASNLDVTGSLVLTGGAVSNRGYFRLSGSLSVNGTAQQFGPLILAGNSLISLGGCCFNPLRFGDSSGQAWDSASILVITNWDSLPNGTGFNSLYFGMSSNALTSRQLGQIQFVNPAHFLPGIYPAKLLASGELVPGNNVLTLFQQPVVAWAQSGSANPVPPGLSNLVAVAAGYDYSAALGADGTVVAWGDPTYGATYVPYGLSNVVAIAAGYAYMLALRADGTVAAWGGNTYGQTSVPAGLNQVIAISAKAYHSLALKADGSIAAWGDNTYGQCNVPAGLSNTLAIAAGNGFSLALRPDGTVAAWGNDLDGETEPPPGLSDVIAVAAGDAHSLALKSDGTVVAWGFDETGQRDIPPGLTNVVAISGGADFSLALRSDGTVVGWGGYPGETNVPPGLARVIDISAGVLHSLALVSPVFPPAFRLGILHPMPGSGLRLELLAQKGRRFQIQFSPDLAAWSPFTNLALIQPTMWFSPPAASQPRGFFRAAPLP